MKIELLEILDVVVMLENLSKGMERSADDNNDVDVINRNYLAQAYAFGKSAEILRDAILKSFPSWKITYETKPIPDRQFDYNFVHEDYDGAPDGNHLCGNAASFSDAIKQIIEIEANQ